MMFCSGKNILTDLRKKANTHKKGMVILGPPGIGKTTFVKNQENTKQNWIDTDIILSKLKAHSTTVHNYKVGSPEFILNYKRCDYSLLELKHSGFWVIGALFYDTIKNIIKYMKKIAKDNKIPIFDSIEEAAKYCEKNSNKK